MAWEEVEQTLSCLMKASQGFDCLEVVEILKAAPTGFAPNGQVADLVWCNGDHRLSIVSPENEKIRRFPG